MKKKLIICVISLFATIFAGISAHAAVGDVAGEALYTDICAYINHYPISSYAVNGCTAVVAEDLAQYGMNVAWNNSDRSLNITRNYDAAEITGGIGVYKSSYPTGTKFSDVYETDIKVYVEGIKVDAYALSGYTLVAIESLTPIGEFTWDNSTRSSKLWIDGLHVKTFVPSIQRVNKIYDADDYAAYSFEYFEHWEDINRDGTPDPIKVSGKYDDYGYICTATISMGGSTITTDAALGIKELYLCDISPYDNSMELLAVYAAENDWGSYSLYRYTGDRIFQIKGDNEYGGIGGCLGSNIYVNINPDCTLTLSQHTNSMGMWNYYVTYEVKNGVLKKIPQDYYPISPDFNSEPTKYMTYNELHDWGYVDSWYEYQMLCSGYVMAHADFSNLFMRYNSARPAANLRRGEYFRLVYDDGNDWVYILKADGTGGWLDISFNNMDYTSRERVSKSVFYMAG